MNPAIALQLRKGGDAFAYTSWGLFGQGFIAHSVAAGGTQDLIGEKVEGTSTVSGQLEVALDGESTGDADLTATLPKPDLASSVGRGTIPLATLDIGINDLDGESSGVAELSADLSTVSEVPYKPTPYPMAYGVPTVDELFALVYGSATTHSLNEGQAKLEISPEIDAGGDSTVEGTLSHSNFLDGESSGDSLVEGELTVIGVTAELDGESTGESECYMRGDLSSDFSPNFTWAYYIYGNVITGFNPTDHVDGSDGDIRDFNRYLSLYKNINVGFDYTDDVSHYSTFVSQSYPDGDIIRDFARHKYQYLLVIPEIEPPFKRLTIGPAPRKPRDLTPTPRPPRKK